MSAWSNDSENELAKALFNKTTWSAIAADPYYVALHEANPGEAGKQNTSETDYGAYARVSTSCTSVIWEVTANVVTNTDTITFATCTGGTNTVSHVSIGEAATNTGTIICYGTLSASLLVTENVVPTFAPGAIVMTFGN